MHGAKQENGSSLALMTMGAIGVVYGDIGTSPLYAFREALAQPSAWTTALDDIFDIGNF